MLFRSGLDAPLPADGAVTVSINSEAAALDTTGRALLVAQIERTLTQVAGIHSVSVRALGDGEDPRDADAGTALGGAADLDAAPGASGQAIGINGGNGRSISISPVLIRSAASAIYEHIPKGIPSNIERIIEANTRNICSTVADRKSVV